MMGLAEQCRISSTYFYKRTSQSVCKICHKSYSFGSTLYLRGHFRKNHPSFFTIIKAGYTYDEAKQRMPGLLKKKIRSKQSLKTNEFCETIDEQIPEAVIDQHTLSNKFNQSNELQNWTVEIPTAENSNKTQRNSFLNENVKVKRTLHNVEFLTYFRMLQQNERYIDVKLCAEGRLIKCHRLVLSSVSEHFENILKDIPVNEVPVIYLNSVPYWVLDTLVQYMYTGEFEVETDKLPELQKVAKDLKVKGFEAAILQSQKTKKGSSAYGSSCFAQATNGDIQMNSILNNSRLTPERSPILKKGFFSVLMPKKVRWKDSVNEDLVQYSNEDGNQNGFSLEQIAPESTNSSNNRSDISPHSPKNRGSPRLLTNKTNQKDLKVAQSSPIDSELISLSNSDTSPPKSPICKRLKFDENADTARLKEPVGLSTAKIEWRGSTGAMTTSPKNSKNLGLTPEDLKKDINETISCSPKTRSNTASKIDMNVSKIALPGKSSPITGKTLSLDSGNSHSSGNDGRKEKRDSFLLNQPLTIGDITLKRTSKELRRLISDGVMIQTHTRKRKCVIIESDKTTKAKQSPSNKVNCTSSPIPLKKLKNDSPEQPDKKVLRSNTDRLSQTEHLNAASNDVNDTSSSSPLKKHKSDSPEQTNERVLRSNSEGPFSQTQHLSATPNGSKEKNTKLESNSPKKQDVNGSPSIQKRGRLRNETRTPEMAKQVSPELASSPLGGNKCRSSSLPKMDANNSSKEDKTELQLKDTNLHDSFSASKGKKCVETPTSPKNRGRPRSIGVITETVKGGITASNGIKHRTLLTGNFCETNAKNGPKNNTAGDTHALKKKEKSSGKKAGQIKPNNSNGILTNSKNVKIVRRFSMSDFIKGGKKNDESCIDIETPKKRGRPKSISLFETNSKDTESNKSSVKKERTNTSSKNKKAKLSQEKLSDETLSSSVMDVESSPLHRYLQLKPVTSSLKRNLKTLQVGDKKRQSEKATALMLYIKNASQNILKTRRKLAITAWRRYHRNKTNIAKIKPKNADVPPKGDACVFDFGPNSEVKKEQKPKSKTTKKRDNGVLSKGSKNGIKKTNTHITATEKRRAKKEYEKYLNNIKRQEQYKRIIESCKKKKLTVRLSQSDLK